MSCVRHGLATLARLVFIAAWLLPVCGIAEVVEDNSPRYWDDAARLVVPGTMPFALPASSDNANVALQVRRLCVQGRKIVAQVHNSLVHFDLATGSAYAELFPFHIADITCADPARMHILALTWPEGRMYSIAVKTDDPWSGLRRGNPISLLKDEIPLGYVEGDSEVRVLTTQRLLSLKGDKLDKAIRLSKRIERLALARVAIVRTGTDIYFGNDGGEWGGTLFRLDQATGKISLAQSGDPVVSIALDPQHADCVLVARGLAHITLADGELLRACHGTTQTLMKNEPVWGVAGKNPIFVAFSDGIGELKDDVIVNRRAYPQPDAVVAGMHYAQLPGVLLASSGISQSVSVSGPVPTLVEWRADAAQ